MLGFNIGLEDGYISSIDPSLPSDTSYTSISSIAGSASGYSGYSGSGSGSCIVRYWRESRDSEFWHCIRYSSLAYNNLTIQLCKIHILKIWFWMKWKYFPNQQNLQKKNPVFSPNVSAHFVIQSKNWRIILFRIFWWIHFVIDLITII